VAVSNVSNQKTIQEIIDSTSKKAKERKTGELGKDDFLNLLVTQLRYQDPMNPVDDKEFIGQMAQFSSLEQMQNMNNSITASKAFDMIGKMVKANIQDDATLETKLVEGRVESVKIDGGKTFVVINGKEVPVEKVTNVTDGYDTFNDSNISQYTGLIGFEAKGAVYDVETGDLISVEGTVKQIQKGRYENYAVMDGVRVHVSAVNTDEASTDPDFRKNYLEVNKGKEVSLIVSDGYGKEVPVTGILNSYSITPEGRITAVLDELYVSVDSIHNIKEKVQEDMAGGKTVQEETEEDES